MRKKGAIASENPLHSRDKEIGDTTRIAPSFLPNPDQTRSRQGTNFQSDVATWRGTGDTSLVRKNKRSHGVSECFPMLAPTHPGLAQKSDHGAAAPRGVIALHRADCAAAGRKSGRRRHSAQVILLLGLPQPQLLIRHDFPPLLFWRLSLGASRAGHGVKTIIAASKIISAHRVYGGQSCGCRDSPSAGWNTKLFKADSYLFKEPEILVSRSASPPL